MKKKWFADVTYTPDISCAAYSNAEWFQYNTIQYKLNTIQTQHNTIQYNSNAERLLARITFVTSGGEKLDGVCLALVKKTQPFFINIILIFETQLLFKQKQETQKSIQKQTR